MAEEHQSLLSTDGEKINEELKPFRLTSFVFFSAPSLRSDSAPSFLCSHRWLPLINISYVLRHCQFGILSISSLAILTLSELIIWICITLVHFTFVYRLSFPGLDMHGKAMHPSPLEFSLRILSSVFSPVWILHELCSFPKLPLR